MNWCFPILDDFTALVYEIEYTKEMTLWGTRDIRVKLGPGKILFVGNSYGSVLKMLKKS